MDLKNISDKIISENYKVSQQEAEQILQYEDLEQLLQEAHRIRTHYLKNDFDTCSIMNAKSGKCSEDCKWCSQSAFHTSKIDVYPLVSSQEAIEQAQYNTDKGVRRFSLVTSGRKLTKEQTSKAAGIYKEIAQESDIFLCASMGLLTKEQLQELYDAGVRRYHCNLETAPSLFDSLCATHTMGDKIQTIRWAREVGMEICSGGIIGMGETVEQRVEFAVTLRDIGIDSIPMNILNPIEGTKLEEQPPLTVEQMLRTFAMFRFVNPKVHIRFAGGRGVLSEKDLTRAINGGISGAMLGDLLTTVGSNIEGDKRLFREQGFEL